MLHRLVFLVLLLNVISSAPSTACAAPGIDNSQLAKTVILCRHGVRSPLQDDKTLAQWSKRAWPAWPVSPGHLTKRGSTLIRAQGQALRQHLAWIGLFPETGCLSPDTVFLYADVSQRTQETGKALAEGLAPGCGLTVTIEKGTESSHSPLFHPVKSGRQPSPVLSQEARQDLLNKIKEIRSELSTPMASLSALLGPASPSLCVPSREDCLLLDIPDRLHIPPPGSHQQISLKGGMSIASTFSEILLLQTLEWPVRSQSIPVMQATLSDSTALSPAGHKALQIILAPRQDIPDVPLHLPVPENRRTVLSDSPSETIMTNPETTLDLLQVHTAIQNTVQRQPEVAASDGGALLDLMSLLLTGDSPLPAANQALLVCLVGHDTNIDNVAGLLNAHWNNAPFPPDSTPPGSMLVLNLWNSPQGKLVQAEYLRLPLTTFLSTDEAVMAQAALVRHPIALPGATLPTPVGPAMKLEDFQAMVRALTATGSTLKGIHWPD